MKALALFISFVVGTLACTAGVAQNRFEISLENGLVSVDATDTDPGLILQALAEKGGFELLIAAGLQAQPVSMRFERLPLRQALRRLLREINHLLIYDDGAALRAIHLLPEGEAPPIAAQISLPRNPLTGEEFPEQLTSQAIAQRLRELLSTRTGDAGQADPPSPAPLDKIAPLLRQIEEAGIDLEQRLPAAGGAD